MKAKKQWKTLAAYEVTYLAWQYQNSRSKKKWPTLIKKYGLKQAQRIVKRSRRRATTKNIIEGYKEGDKRDLQMFGPIMSVWRWKSTMTKALAPGKKYNDFQIAKTEKMLKKFGVKKVHPARENSVALYFLLPKGFSDLKGLFSRSNADEISTHSHTPKGDSLDKNWQSKKTWKATQKALDNGTAVWVRMWWD